MITIYFFAQLREQLQCEKLTLEISMPASISSVREYIVQQNPQWQHFLNNDKLLFSVNQTLVKASHAVNDGDEIAFFPPVTGG